MTGFDPIVENLLRIYAKRFGISVDELVKELESIEGADIVEKLENYVQSRRGLSVVGNLLTVYKEKTYEMEDGTKRYRVAVMTYLNDDERKKIIQHFGLHEDDVPPTAVFTLWLNDKRQVDTLHDIVVGSRVLMTGVRVTTGTQGGIFLNARNIIPRGIDFDFLGKEASKPEALKNEAFEENDPAIINLTGATIVPDPIEKTTSSGQPKVRVYVDDAIVLDFYGTAYTKLSKRGDVYSPEFWKELASKPLFVRALYSRHFQDMPFFRVVQKSDIAL